MNKCANEKDLKQAARLLLALLEMARGIARVGNHGAHRMLAGFSDEICASRMLVSEMQSRFGESITSSKPGERRMYYA